MFNPGIVIYKILTNTIVQLRQLFFIEWTMNETKPGLL